MDNNISYFILYFMPKIQWYHMDNNISYFILYFIPKIQFYVWHAVVYKLHDEYDFIYRKTILRKPNTTSCVEDNQREITLRGHDMTEIQPTLKYKLET